MDGRFTLTQLALFAASLLPLAGELDPFAAESGAATDLAVESSRFSNTQSWNSVALEFTQKKAVYLGDWKRKLALPAPPASSSVRTERELQYLRELQDERQDLQVEEIVSEIDLKGFRLAGFRYVELTDEQGFPKTRRLLRAAFARSLGRKGASSGAAPHSIGKSMSGEASGGGAG